MILIVAVFLWLLLTGLQICPDTPLSTKITKHTKNSIIHFEDYERIFFYYLFSITSLTCSYSTCHVTSWSMDEGGA